MLGHTAGLALAAGAGPIVFRPGSLLGRERSEAIDAVVDQLRDLRERLEAKGLGVPLGVEIMGRVRKLGTPEDCFAIAGRLGWVRPVLDFAHLHAVTDGAFTDVEAFAGILRLADQVMEPDARSHIHFSDIAYADRRSAVVMQVGHAPQPPGT